MEINYQNKIVAFIDILGFKGVVHSLSKNPDLHKRLILALSRFKFIEQHSVYVKENTCLEVSVFSDSIVVSAEEKDFLSLIFAVGWLQADLLLLGILTRGGIALGELYHEKGILYGEGLLSAYNLEVKVAVYPRIVVSEKISQLSSKIGARWIEKDFDGFRYINPFKFDAAVAGAEELASEGYEPRGLYLEEVRKYLIEGMAQASEEDHLAKYRWIVGLFNRHLSEFNSNSLNRINLITF